MPFSFQNTYARLPEHFFVRQPAAAKPEANIVKINHGLAKALGVNGADLETRQSAEILSATRIAQGSEPLAMAYAGHQFGNWVPQLGDGRAVLLGEVVARDGMRFDIHLKGSGLTPFSRGGDGKAVLGAAIREYIVSEAMAALGIPTTRALAVVSTGETVLRDTALPGAVLTRVAQSHVRVGTFQYFFARQDIDALQRLTDYVIHRHYPEAAKAEIPALALLQAVLTRQAELIASWMQVGFIHGVMNTDNMSIAGETIDYGPCAFMDEYHPAKVFSSIDQQGRYAYGNQPNIAHWNLAQFAQCLLPLIPLEPDAAAKEAQAVIDRFPAEFNAAHNKRIAAKIGLDRISGDDTPIFTELFELMAADTVDFTLFFTALTNDLATSDGSETMAMFQNPTAFSDWRSRWLERLGDDKEKAIALMRAANPVYIARNHRVEQAISAAYQGNFEPFETLLKVLAHPFIADPSTEDYQAAPRPDEIVHETFCGT